VDRAELALASATIEHWFSQISLEAYEVTSPKDGGYNCFAFAADDTTRKWDPTPPWYWPVANRDLNISIETIIDCYQFIGYEVDEGKSMAYEEGFEKIAIYTKNNIVKHAAKQENNGLWKSKLGDYWDIHHTLAGLEGKKYDEYGKVAIVLKRELQE